MMMTSGPQVPKRGWYNGSACHFRSEGSACHFRSEGSGNDVSSALHTSHSVIGGFE